MERRGVLDASFCFPCVFRDAYEGRHGFLKTSSEGLRSLRTSSPWSAWSLSLEGEGRIDFGVDVAGSGILDKRGMPLGRLLTGVPFSIFIFFKSQ